MKEFLGSVVRGGLFSAELVRWKIGQIDDVLARELPALTGQPPAAVPVLLAGASEIETASRRDQRKR